MPNPSSRIRVFAGIPLNAACEHAAVGLVRSLRAENGPLAGARLSCPARERLHLTLKFCGDVDEDHVPAMLKALRNISWNAFTLRLGGAGVFPGLPRPRVFWAGVQQGAKQLTALAGKVDQGLRVLGVEPERRSYHPHLTLCRVREARDADWQEALVRAQEAQWPELPIERIVLWQSTLQPAGPEYRVLGEALAEI